MKHVPTASVAHLKFLLEQTCPKKGGQKELKWNLHRIFRKPS